MMNECYTYFNVYGDFDPDELSAALGLKPFRVIKKGTPRSSEHDLFDFSACAFCRNDKYHYDVNVIISETIKPLRDKIKLLNELREALGVEYSIVVVPQIYAGESTPALGLDLDTIDFCHAIRAYVDIDMYVYDK